MLLVYEEKQFIMVGMAANIHLALFPECGYLAHFLLFYFIDYPSPGDGDTHTQGRSSLFSLTSLKSSSEIHFHNDSKVNQIDAKASMAFLTLLSDSYSSYKSCGKVNYWNNKQEAGDTFLILGFCSSLATGFSSEFAKETITV